MIAHKKEFFGGLVLMVLFLAVLGATLLYAWKKGALEWEK